MKIFLLAFTFLALFSFNASAVDGGCQRFNIGSSIGKDHQDGLYCFPHYTMKTFKGAEFNEEVKLIHTTTFFISTKKKRKKLLGTIKHIMSENKDRCLMRNNKNSYLFLGGYSLDRHLESTGGYKNFAIEEPGGVYYIQGAHRNDTNQSIYLFCGNDEFEALEDLNVLIKHTWPITHFYKNEISKSAIYEIDLNKSKAIKDKSAKEEKAKKIQPLKDDCKDLGFTENTEAMGNCILKLMELKQSTTSSGQSQSSDDTSVSEWLGIANDGINMMSGNSSSSSSASHLCTKTGEDKQAFNTVCYYKCGTTTYTHNLGTGAGVCPITKQF